MMSARANALWMLAGMASKSAPVRPQFSQITYWSLSKPPATWSLAGISQIWSYLYPYFSALLYDGSSGLDCRKPIGMVSQSRIQEEVLHINDHERRSARRDRDGCIWWPVGGAHGEGRRGTTGEIISLCRPIVTPLVSGRAEDQILRHLERVPVS